MRDLGQIPDSHPKWIMLDGGMDASIMVQGLGSTLKALFVLLRRYSYHEPRYVFASLWLVVPAIPKAAG